MITIIEYLFLAVLTLGTGLLSAYIVYKVVEPRAKRFISDYERTVPARIKKEVVAAIKEGAENIDLGAIAGQLGGGEGEGSPLGAIGDLLGGGGGGIGELLKLLSAFGGKGKEGGGSSGW